MGTNRSLPPARDGQVFVTAEKTRGGYPLLRVRLGQERRSLDFRLNTQEAWALLGALEEQLRGRPRASGGG